MEETRVPEDEGKLVWVVVLGPNSENPIDEEFVIEESDDDTEITVVCSAGIKDVDEELKDFKTFGEVENEKLKAELLVMLEDEVSELAKVSSKLEPDEDVDIWEIVTTELENKLVIVVDKGFSEKLVPVVKMLAEVEVSVVENDAEEIIEAEADDIGDALDELDLVISEVEESMEGPDVKETLELNKDCFKEETRLSFSSLHPSDSVLLSHMYRESKLKPNPFPAPLAK